MKPEDQSVACVNLSVVIASAVASSALLAAVKTPIGMAFGAFWGTVALLLAALIIIRIMPNGISASLQKYFIRRGGGAMQ